MASVSEAKWRLDEDPELAEPRNFRMASDDWHVTPEDEPPGGKVPCAEMFHVFLQ